MWKKLFIALFAVLVAGCANLYPDAGIEKTASTIQQYGIFGSATESYWWQCREPSKKPINLIYTKSFPPACTKASAGMPLNGCAVDPPWAEEYFIYINSSLKGPQHNCTMRHEYNHYMGMCHLETHPRNEIAHCGPIPLPKNFEPKLLSK